MVIPSPSAVSASTIWDGLATKRSSRPNESEGIFLAGFDLDLLRKYRKLQTWGDAYRKPQAYKAIVADAPAPIFKRNDSRRTPWKP